MLFGDNSQVMGDNTHHLEYFAGGGLCYIVLHVFVRMDCKCLAVIGGCDLWLCAGRWDAEEAVVVLFC